MTVYQVLYCKEEQEVFFGLRLAQLRAVELFEQGYDVKIIESLPSGKSTDITGEVLKVIE